MKEIVVCKAEGVSDEPVEGVALRIELPLPTFDDPNWRKASRAHFQKDAQWVLNALKVLPGGTKRALMILLLEEEICLLRVRAGT